MAIKRKDFQKTSSTILEFLLKLPDEEISARLRDTLLHGLHFLQQYYLILQKRDKEQKPLQWTIERGLSPLTPFREAPDKFKWPWIDVESNKVKQTIPKHSLNNFVTLSPIIVAVREGDLRYVKELLNAEPELIDQTDSFGRDLLTYAVQYQQIKILRYLLLECNASAKINIQANDGSTCLHRACYSDDEYHCNLEIVRILLENHADVMKQDVHLRSPLHWAVLAENIDCLKLLIDYNVDIHVKDIDGMTPAMWACHLDRHEHFKELSRYMNNDIEKDNDGRSWIHHSIRKTEPLECLKYLLSEESILLRDKDGRTCLHVAAEQGSVHACRLIFQMSKKSNLTSYVHDGDTSRQTPLHLATINGHARVLKELLDNGADPHLKDIQGISAFDYAKNRGLYFCRSVFEVYLREKNTSNLHSRPSTTRTFNTNSSIKKINGHDLTPTPPVNGHATFIRRNGRQSFTDSSVLTNYSSPSVSIEQFSRTTNYPNSSSILSNHEQNLNNDLNEYSRSSFRPPSSSTTTNNSIGPPVKPRKSSSFINSSKPQSNHNHITTTITHSEDDDDDDDEDNNNDDANSLDGHGGNSDFDDDEFFKQERPNSRLSVHKHEDHLPIPTNHRLRRPHYKQAKQSTKISTYDDFRYLDEQALHSPNKSKTSTRSKDLPQSSSNRIGSSNQTSTNRLKSGSKSSSTESIPTLDLTVAGQKLFRTKQQVEINLTNTMRPPSGRLKPLNSAKSTSSYADDLSSKTLEDVTNNVKQSSSSTTTKTHLYKKKLTPLINGNDIINKKSTYRTSIDQPSYMLDDVPSDKSEETSYKSDKWK